MKKQSIDEGRFKLNIRMNLLFFSFNKELIKSYFQSLL